MKLGSLLALLFLPSGTLLMGQGVSVNRGGATALLQYSQIQDCFHNKVINPMCQVTMAGTTYNVFGNGDLLTRINAVIAAGYTSGITIQVPPDTYSIGSAPMSIQSLHNFTVDMTGSILHPSVANFTPFVTGNAPLSNVRLVGGRFLPATNSTRFFGYAGGTYTKANYGGVGGVTSLNTITGLDLYPEEVGGTAGAAINIQSLTNNVNTSWLALQKVRVRGWFHDTGGESVVLQGCNDCLLDHVKSESDGLAGPDHGFSPDNVNISGSNIRIDQIDCSGTAIWNDTPFIYNAPAACVYLYDVDGFSVTGHFHDSACTYELCVNTGAIPNRAQISLPNAGTPDNYQYMPDCLHVDQSRRGDVSISCSHFSQGIVLEVSHNVTVSHSSISETYGAGMQESSRAPVQVINQLSATAGLVAGPGVISLTAGTSLPYGLASCPGGCVQAALPPHFSGTVMYQDSSSGWSTFLNYPAFQTMSSAAQVAGGVYSLFLSPSASCTDPRGISLPFPQMDSVFLAPILQPYFLDVPNISQMAYMTSMAAHRSAIGFSRWCVNATDIGAASSILTLGGLQFQIFGEGNVFSASSISRTGLAGMIVSGPGIGPLITGISFTDPVLYGSNLGANGQGAVLQIGTGSSLATRTGFSFTDSTVNMTRAPKAVGEAFPAIWIGNIGANTDSPIPDPVIRNITFVGSTRPTSLVETQYPFTNVPYLDLHTSGIVGLNQTNSDDSGEVALGSTASGLATVPLTRYYSVKPRYLCTDESPPSAVVNCYASRVTGNTWQLNIKGTGTDLIGYTKVSQ